MCFSQLKCHLSELLMVWLKMQLNRPAIVSFVVNINLTSVEKHQQFIITLKRNNDPWLHNNANPTYEKRRLNKSLDLFWQLI